MQRDGLAEKNGINQDQHQHGEQNPHSVGNHGTNPLGRMGEPDRRDGPADRGKEGCHFTDKGHIAARKKNGMYA